MKEVLKHKPIGVCLQRVCLGEWGMDEIKGGKGGDGFDGYGKEGADISIRKSIWKDEGLRYRGFFSLIFFCLLTNPG